MTGRSARISIWAIAAIGVASVILWATMVAGR